MLHPPHDGIPEVATRVCWRVIRRPLPGVVNGSADGGYSASNEAMFADLPANQLVYATDCGLAAPGSKAAFKVYVVTETGNEKGSNAVTPTRPVNTPA